MQAPKLVITGRDGILNVFRADHVKAPEEWEPIPGALEAVARLNHAGWHVVVATNQSGIGRGMIDMASVNAVHAYMNQRLATQGGRLDAVFFCPHTPEEQCDCRKPLPGMMLRASEEMGIHLPSSYVVGDTVKDIEMGHRVGATTVLVLTGYGRGELELHSHGWKVRPHHVAADLLEAVEWILAREKESAA